MINRFDLVTPYNFNIVKTKKNLYYMYYKQLMRYLMRLIKIKNLPETMPENDIKFNLFSMGYITIGKANDDKLYGFNGQLGGEPTPYYLPTISVVANAALDFSKTFTIDKDCVVVKCDSLYQGFNSIISLYASLLTTIDISIYWSTINARTQNLYESGNDTITKSINDVFAKLEDGDELKAIASKPLFDFIKTREFSSANVATNIKSLIELKQYCKASYYQIIGLPSNYNMKRESLNENELDADIYTITPLIDEAFEQIKEDFEKVNKMFNQSIEVEASSSYKQVKEDIENRAKEEELDIELEEAQIEASKEAPEDEEVKEVNKDEDNK